MVALVTVPIAQHDAHILRNSLSAQPHLVGADVENCAKLRHFPAFPTKCSGGGHRSRREQPKALTSLKTFTKIVPIVSTEGMSVASLSFPFQLLTMKFSQSKRQKHLRQIESSRCCLLRSKIILELNFLAAHNQALRLQPTCE